MYQNEINHQDLLLTAVGPDIFKPFRYQTLARESHIWRTSCFVKVGCSVWLCIRPIPAVFFVDKEVARWQPHQTHINSISFSWYDIYSLIVETENKNYPNQRPIFFCDTSHCTRKSNAALMKSPGCSVTPLVNCTWLVSPSPTLPKVGTLPDHQWLEDHTKPNGGWTTPIDVFSCIAGGLLSLYMMSSPSSHQFVNWEYVPCRKESP